MKEQKDWKKESFDILEDYQTKYGFKNSALYDASITTYRMDGKTRFWITVHRDGIYYEYMYKTWKELFVSLDGILTGICICEGSVVRRRTLIRELVEQGIHMDIANEMIDKKIAEKAV